jgi:hypothetical protein
MVTVVYLHEFLVNGYDFISPMSQQGTKAAKRLFKNRIAQAIKELTSII